MKTVFVAGHLGMVGSALCRALSSDVECQLLKRNRQELDLTNQYDVRQFFETERIDEVYIAAAKVGGIHANNTYPAEFIYDNLMIQANIIDSAFRFGVKKILFLGSTCIYPRSVAQPMKEEALLTGPLEPTNEPYAIAKIAGIKMCESYNRQYEHEGIDFRSVMPTNLYGVGDNYHPENSHVIPALIRRFHQAKVNSFDQVNVWGTGNAMREFLYVDDMASACLHVMNLPKGAYDLCVNAQMSHMNVGSGVEMTIRDLTAVISEVIGYSGRIIFDKDKPDGTPRKLVDSSRLISTGWKPSTDIHRGISTAYADFLASAKIS